MSVEMEAAIIAEKLSDFFHIQVDVSFDSLGIAVNFENTAVQPRAKIGAFLSESKKSFSYASD